MSTEWPITYDGDEYYPLKPSWLDHPAAVDTESRGGPRLFAVSVVTPTPRVLRIRYTHPRTPQVLVCETPATDHNGGFVPEALVNRSGWPRSLRPGRSEPVDTRYAVESRHLRELWGERTDAVPTDAETKRAIADGGTASRNPLHPKVAGSSVESAVIDREPALSYVGDRDCEWCDAETSGLLTPRSDRPFGSLCVIESGTPVEIKGTIPAQGNGDGTTPVTGSIPVSQCADCGGRWFEATPERMACDRCGDRNASRVFNSEHNRLCEDCIAFENQSQKTGTELAYETVECWRCGNQRYTYESCHHCGASCKPLTKRKQQAQQSETEHSDPHPHAEGGLSE